MFVLRSKVSIADESDAWAQFGIWDKSARVVGVAWDGGVVTARVDEGRFLRMGRGAFACRDQSRGGLVRSMRSAPEGR